MHYLKRANDVLLVNDETLQLNDSEEDIEKMIANAPRGGKVFPRVRR